MAGKVHINYELVQHENQDVTGPQQMYDNQIDPTKAYRIVEKRHCDCGAPDTKKLLGIFFDKDFANKVLTLIS